jgi:hypothetical protein
MNLPASIKRIETIFSVIRVLVERSRMNIPASIKRIETRDNDIILRVDRAYEYPRLYYPAGACGA